MILIFFFLVRIGIRIDKGTLDFRRNTNRQWYVENSNQTTRPFGCFLVSGWIENHFAFRAKSKMLSRCCFALSYTTYRIIIIMSVNGRDTKTSCIRSNANEICIRNGFYQHFFFFVFIWDVWLYVLVSFAVDFFSCRWIFFVPSSFNVFFSVPAWFSHSKRCFNILVSYWIVEKVFTSRRTDERRRSVAIVIENVYLTAGTMQLDMRMSEMCCCQLVDVI